MNNWYARLINGTTTNYFANEAELNAYYKRTYEQNVKGGYINAEETRLEEWRNSDTEMEYNDDYRREADKMRIITQEQWNKIPKDYKGTFVDYQGNFTEAVGRRTAMLPGEGCVSSIEGIHFLVAGDYSHLPALTKKNAKVGHYYRICDKSYEICLKLYTISQEEADKDHLCYLDRVITTMADKALYGGPLSNKCHKEG